MLITENSIQHSEKNLNQKTKIYMAMSAVLTVAAVTAFAVDTSVNSATQTKNGGANGVGLSKNEEVVKPAVPSASTIQNSGPKESLLSQIGTPALPQAAPSTTSSSLQVTTSSQSPSPPPPSWGGPTLGDLEKLRSENAMLAEQLKNAELKKKIGEQGGVANSPDANRSTGSLATKAPSGPRVVMIAGGEGNYRANLMLPNGQSMTAMVGSSVPGYGVVNAITPNEILFKSKKSIPLITNGANADYVMSQ